MLVRLMAMIGVILHELCHLLMCVITNSPVDEVKLLERVKIADQKGHKRYEYGGRVMLRGDKELTFLQAMLIGLAPLMISFWIFFFLLDFLLITPEISIIIFFLIIILMVSIVLAAAPSAIDILNIPASFQQNPDYSLYQIGLFILSILSVWGISFFISFFIFHEIIYYVLIGICYCGYKHGIKGIRTLFQTNSNLNHQFPIWKSGKNRHQNNFKNRRKGEIIEKYSR